MLIKNKNSYKMDALLSVPMEMNYIDFNLIKPLMSTDFVSKP
jgi:hypothetical protein